MTSGGLKELAVKGNIKMKGLGALLLFALFLVPSPVFPSPIVLESDAQFDFARTLMKGGEYSRAVMEFERFLYFFPRDDKVPSARHLIGVCYFEDGHHETAREVFARIIESYSPGPLAGEALFLIGESYYRQGLSEEAIHYFIQVIERFPEPSELKNAALYRLGWAEMREERWHKASEIFLHVGKEGPYFDSAQGLASQSLKGALLPYKNPSLAGGLAAVLPGLGHAYVGRYRDGAVAFLLNGVFILASVEAFRNDLEILGGILAFLELGWYSGNIYSAVNAAHKYNLRLRNDFLDSLNDGTDYFPPRSSEGRLGLSFQFRF
jgi:tetratricopeptide (TPR) repeat protein